MKMNNRNQLSRHLRNKIDLQMFPTTLTRIASIVESWKGRNHQLNLLLKDL